MSASTEAIDDLIAWARGDGGVIEFDHPGDEHMAVCNLADAAAAELAALCERVASVEMLYKSSQEALGEVMHENRMNVERVARLEAERAQIAKLIRVEDAGDRLVDHVDIAMHEYDSAVANWNHHKLRARRLEVAINDAHTALLTWTGHDQDFDDVVNELAAAALRER